MVSLCIRIQSISMAKPRSVVTLLIVNSDGATPAQYDSVFQSVGLATLSFAPASASLTVEQWPTLGSMIDSGKRLVTFMDAGADFTSVPYIINGVCLHSISLRTTVD